MDQRAFGLGDAGEHGQHYPVSDPFSREFSHTIESGRFAFTDRGDYAFATCHVDDVVEAVQCALERGEGGRAFFINGLLSMPYWLASIVGRLLEAIWAITRKKATRRFPRSMMRMIGREFSTDDAAARRELGYVERTSRTDAY